MFPLIDLVASVGGLVVSPLFDFLKKKFIKSENDTPERTVSTLATTKPEVVGDYVKAVADLNKSKVDYFNRDVIGVPSKWVIDLRAAIRPIGVSIALGTLIMMVIMVITGHTELLKDTGIAGSTITGVRATCELMVSSWFGHRISISK